MLYGTGGSPLLSGTVYAATAINSRSLLGFHASLQCVHSLHLVYPGLLRMNDYWDHKIHCSLVNSQKSSKNNSFTREKSHNLAN